MNLNNTKINSTIQSSMSSFNPLNYTWPTMSANSPSTINNDKPIALLINDAASNVNNQTVHLNNLHNQLNALNITDGNALNDNLNGQQILATHNLFANYGILNLALKFYGDLTIINKLQQLVKDENKANGVNNRTSNSSRPIASSNNVNPIKLNNVRSNNANQLSAYRDLLVEPQRIQLEARSQFLNARQHVNWSPNDTLAVNEQQEQIQIPAYKISRSRRRSPSCVECVFCKNNGLEPELYKSHILKDPEGIIQCKVLRSYNCPICQNGGGDYAHTVR